MTFDIMTKKEIISTVRNKEVIEKEMLKLPQVPCDVTHSFGPGVYMRQVFLPAGSLVMGHHQNFEHANIFIKGRITFFSDDGERFEMKAPMTFVAKPGRKIAYIHEDSLWMNIYSTNETNVEKLESHYLTKSDSWLTDNKEKFQSITSSVDKSDFERVLQEFSLPKYLGTNEDLSELPFGSFKIKTGPSKIEGTGLFATSNIKSEETIAPGSINLKPTIASRYINHSAFPNAKIVKKGSEIFLIAIKDISGCHGGQDGEEITINYRDSLGGNKLCQQSQ